MEPVYDVLVQCNVHCGKRRGEPRYRVWVNDQLFTERTWTWSDDFYLEEVIPIRAARGHYAIRYELVEGDQGALTANNWQVLQGTAQIDRWGRLEI